jgi:site-specific recombinase XerD
MCRPKLRGEGCQRAIKLNNNPYVIAGHHDGHYLSDMQSPWRCLRKVRDLEDVRKHGLRCAFASHGVARGQGLPIIGMLLRHFQLQTTARYAHRADDL